MPRYRSIKNSFLGGEISPKVDGRVDLPQYLQGARELLNQLVMPQGGTCRRPGTQCGRGTFSEAGRVLPFVFSETEAFAAHCVASGSIAAYATSLSDATTSGVKRAINGSAGLSLGALSSSELQALQYAQSGDVMVIVHPNHKPTFFKRFIGGGLYWKPFDYQDDGSQKTGSDLVKSYPFLSPNATATTITPSAASGTGVTLTATTNLFHTDHIGAIFKITHGATTGAVVITARGGSPDSNGLSLTATADFLKNCASATATSDWEESAWSTYRGWPRSVAFYESRLVYGGNKSAPTGIWASQQYDMEELMARRFLDDSHSEVGANKTDADSYLTDTTFKKGIRNDDPFFFELDTTRASFIQWLAPKDVLIVGTTGNEIGVEGTNPQLAIGPFNFGSGTVTGHGSSHIQPAITGTAVIFVGRDGRTIRALSPRQNAESKEATNLTKFADHLTIPSSDVASRIVQIEFQESMSTIWALTSTGKLLSAYFDETTGFAAWSHHEIAGTAASVFSMAVVPSNDGRFDDLWMHVSRTVNGSTVRTLEIIGAPFELSALDASTATTVDSPFFADACFAITNASPSASVTGLTWLKGETVAILGDGKYLGTAAVDATTGALTLPRAVTDVVVGLPYTSRVIPTRVEAGSPIGTSQGAIKRHDKVVARLYRSAACKYGSSTSSLKQINFRPASVAFDSPIPLFTGDKKLDWPGDYDENPDVVFETSDPLPMTIVSVVMQGVEYDV
jgi:hypothetical protein